MKKFSAVAAIIFLFSVGATAQTTNGLSDAEIQGHNLAKQLLKQSPATNFTQTGVLEIRNHQGQSKEISIDFQIFVSQTNWSSLYQGIDTSGNRVILEIVHDKNAPNIYFLTKAKANDIWRIKAKALDGNQTTISFANSDFWICDLGLEFFHWPEQKLLRKEVKRSRGCSVLESINPNPSPNGYSRVVSWIDEETLGMVQAKAYDAHGKLLKEFYPKDFKKVNGQWQVQSMEMDNDQTGSRSWIKFDVKKQ